MIVFGVFSSSFNEQELLDKHKPYKKLWNI